MKNLITKILRIIDIFLVPFVYPSAGLLKFIRITGHIIRPEGDVTFIFLQLLTGLNKGVIVHIHDIFSPRNYLSEWLKTEILFWNEQYLLEAFLTDNNNWKITGSMNYLHHNHFEKLKKVCPYLVIDREPGSFYIQKLN